MMNTVSEILDLDRDISEAKNLHWYAVYVRSHHEKKVYQLFIENGVESSLPLVRVMKKWSDRKKIVELPLFRGYVFVRIDVSLKKFNILQLDGVVKFIGIKGEPSVIPDKQMHWIHMMVEQENKIRHEKEIPVGQIVRVIAGPFKGAEGVVKRVGNQAARLVVLMESIMQTVSVEIDPNYLEEIKRG